MRPQRRLMVLCTVALLAAGCSGKDDPTSSNLSNSRLAQCTNTVGSRVWFDTNCNGLQDQDETTGPDSVLVTLRNCDTQAERTTMTDATGAYSFADVATGQYTVCIDIPDGYQAALPNQGGDDGADSDINADGCSECTTFDCALNDSTLAAGLCVDDTPPCSNTVGNRVWYDTNCNGVQDQDETTGPAGVTVTLRNCDTQVERTTTTDANGNYSFTDVPTGEYTLCVDIPDGYRASMEDQGADDGMDSDIGADGCTECREYVCGSDDLSRDAGICVDTGGGGDCSNADGSIWFDVNCNGLKDNDETGGPEGLKVVLRNCDTGEAIVCVTDSNGHFRFGEVESGEYRICIEIPGGYEPTLQDGCADDAVDSDIDEDGCSDCVVLECGGDDLMLDAGLCEKKRHDDD